MLANVLNSQRAILVSIKIIEIFISMREYIMNYSELQIKMELLEKQVGKQDQNIVMKRRHSRYGVIHKFVYL